MMINPGGFTKANKVKTVCLVCEILLLLSELPAICVLCAVADWCVSDGIFLWLRN